MIIQSKYPFINNKLNYDYIKRIMYYDILLKNITSEYTPYDLVDEYGYMIFKNENLGVTPYETN
jgi:hypothetical protein